MDESEATVEPGFAYQLQEMIYQGAEAKVTKCQWLGKPCMIKERLSKGYRHPTLNSRLNKLRLKQEIRGMYKARELGIETPAVYFIDTDRELVVMEWIDGPTAKAWISTQSETLGEEEYDEKMRIFGRVLGLNIGRLHRGGLIHGDLTTSNIILKAGNAEKATFIDFGLSSQGKVTAEEKGVDLYVLGRAIVSTHKRSQALLRGLMEGYQEADGKQFEAVEKKLNEIKLRGRKRDMIG
uniref:non-specific serine/threonine protein kinase n=1 Tax=Caenorhabditis japonica TaxID=281687 RepID=A0A8R1DK52_CAEJA